MRHHHAPRHTLTPDEAADLAADMDEHEFGERIEPICVGPVADGTRSISEAAQELHQFAVWLVELEREGWQLVHQGEDAHLDVINRDPGARLYEPELHEA